MLTFSDAHYIFTALCFSSSRVCPRRLFMKKSLNCVVFILMALSLVAISGCGGGGGSSSPAVDTTSVQKGAVIQGPVVGATVFADNVTGGSRFVLDTGEVTAQTDSSGNFFLPAFPSYDFVLVSTGGTDTISNQPALLLLAPAGSANITPLTTLVAFDTTKAVRAKLETLMGGVKFDSNVATTATPAALMLVKSVEIAVQRVRDIILLAVPVGVTLSEVQVNYIQAQIWQQIALEFASTSQDLATPAGLATSLKNALTVAAVNIRAKNSNISSSFNATSIDSIASSSVTLALGAIGVVGVDSTSTVALNKSSVLTEGSVKNSIVSLLSLSSSFNAATVNLKALSSVVVIGVTPNPYSPTPIPVVTIDNATIIRILTGASGGFPITGITF